jgi:hypothetical protein
MKSTQKIKVTYNWGRVISSVLMGCVRNYDRVLQDILKVLEHLLISQLKGRDHTRRVLRPRVHEAIMLSLLQRLNSAA